MSVTLYVTESGEAVDPAECIRKNGVLMHKSGAKIAMRFPDCPRSRSVDADAEQAKKPAPKPAPQKREIKPEESKKSYTTRETKAD